MAWSELTAILGEAAAYISAENPWYEHGTGIISALSRAYCAHNTVTVLAEQDAQSVVEIMVAPIVESAFLTSQNRLQSLEHAITHDPTLIADPSAQ